METIKGVKPKNDKGQRHGYHEIYNTENELLFRGVFKHGIAIGYTERHTQMLKKITVFCIK